MCSAGARLPTPALLAQRSIQTIRFEDRRCGPGRPPSAPRRATQLSPPDPADVRASAPDGGAASPRSLLFLQGNISLFLRTLAIAARRRGHRLARVNFNGGDAAFWRLPGATDFTGPPDAWPGFFAALLQRERFTDVVLCGDCRPLHAAAIPIARSQGLNVHVAEEGYLRPGWVTFERDGVNAHSGLPRRPEAIREAAADLPEPAPAPPSRSSLGHRALLVVTYHTARFAMGWRFPHYWFHSGQDPIHEIAGWARRWRSRRPEQDAGKALLERLSRSPVFLFPLQLDTDFQVRVHSAFGDMTTALEEVAASFSADAPADAHLLVKSHPLEARSRSWRPIVEDLARRHGVESRLHYIEHKDIYDMIHRARGVITVNSTVGALALELKRPVIALGRAVYDIEGLTFQGPLSAFWTDPPAPDPTLFAAFRKLVICTRLVPGNFFSREGMQLAATAALARLEATPLPPHGCG